MLADRLLEIISESRHDGTSVRLSGIKHNPFKFADTEFSALHQHDSDKLNKSSSGRPISGLPIAFVDGGNAELLSSSAFSLSIVKVAFSIFAGKSMIKFGSMTLFTISTFCKPGKIKIEIYEQKSKLLNKLFKKTTPLQSMPSQSMSSQSMPSQSMPPQSLLPQFILIDESEDCLSDGVFKGQLSRAAELARRMAELSLMKNLMDMKNPMESSSYNGTYAINTIIRDGNLQSQSEPEMRLLKELVAEASLHDTIVGSVAKTSGLLTDSGKPLSSAVDSIASSRNISGAWLFGPIAEIFQDSCNTLMFAARFNKSSRHIFRAEFLNSKPEKNIDCLVSACRALAENSNDPVFLGYPFGLVEAHRLARVEPSDASLLSERIALLSKKQSALQQAISDKDAHGILDRL